MYASKTLYRILGHLLPVSTPEKQLYIMLEEAINVVKKKGTNHAILKPLLQMYKLYCFSAQHKLVDIMTTFVEPLLEILEQLECSTDSPHQDVRWGALDNTIKLATKTLTKYSGFNIESVKGRLQFFNDYLGAEVYECEIMVEMMQKTRIQAEKPKPTQDKEDYARVIR